MKPHLFDKKPVDRRRALKWIAGLAVGCAACGQCGTLAGEGDEAEEKQKDGDEADSEKKSKQKEADPEKNQNASHEARVANVMSLRNERAVEIDEPELILVRTSKGIAAFSAVCTHKHSPLAVDASGQGIYCSLHGSQFGFDGKPANGPASRRLKQYQVRVDDAGDVYVNPKKFAESGAWAPLPSWGRPSPK